MLHSDPVMKGHLCVAQPCPTCAIETGNWERANYLLEQRREILQQESLRDLCPSAAPARAVALAMCRETQTGMSIVQDGIVLTVNSYVEARCGGRVSVGRPMQSCILPDDRPLMDKSITEWSPYVARFCQPPCARTGKYCRPCKGECPAEATHQMSIVPIPIVAAGGHLLRWTISIPFGLPGARPPQVGQDLVAYPHRTLGDATKAVERKLIGQALEEARWNVSAAARRLGLPLSTLKRKMNRLGLSRSGVTTEDRAQPWLSNTKSA